MTVTPEPTAPGQESVWSYPRPAIAEPTLHHLRIGHRGTVIADTTSGIRTLETSHPPSYYFPPADVNFAVLRRSQSRSVCEWKGVATYFDFVQGGETLRDIAWSYGDPTESFTLLRDHIAFYASPFEICSVDGETVTPQPGGFYGGWITSHIAGPFKGVPGSRFW